MPADRFFSAESAVRTSLQQNLAANELRLALDKNPRQQVYPLVLQTDNGAAYRSKVLKGWCAAHSVLQLFSLSRTPQHNGAVEHGMFALKLAAALGSGTIVLDQGDARARLEVARDRIDRNRPRRTRGWMTAVEADRAAPHWSTLVTREQVLENASCALSQALLHCSGKRARRRAEREAILGTLQRVSVIQRTRGGRPWTAQSAEDDS